MRIRTFQGNKSCLLVAVALFATSADYALAAPLDTFPTMPSSAVSVMQMARTIHDECGTILSMVPRLSPAEAEWYAAEAHSGSSARLEHLMRSPEFARQSLYVHFLNCTTYTSAAISGASDQERTLAWANLVSQFSSAIDLEYWGNHAGNNELRDAIIKFSAWERLNTSRIIDGPIVHYLNPK